VNVRKLLYLLAPMATAAVVVLVLHMIRGPAEGTLVLEGGASVDASFRQAAALHSIDLLSSVVFRKTSITVQADRISLSNLPSATFSSVRLDPIEGNVEIAVSQDMSPAIARRLTFKLHPSGTALVRIAHQPLSEAIGFYLDLSAGGPLEATMFYAPGPEEIVLAAHGRRITVLSGPRRGLEINAGADNLIQLKLSARDNPAGITASTPGAGEAFGSLTFRARSATDSVQLFSTGDSATLEIANGSAIDARETSSLFIDGQKINDYRDVRLTVRGEGIRPNRAIQANVSGLQLSVHGRFDDIAIQTAGGSQALLPTRLSRIQGVWAIVLGAAVFLMDKLITIYKFVQPSKDA
jgi:hypothetical protein